MRWFYDERIGRKRPVVRARPIRLKDGQPGMRVELKAEVGISSDLSNILVLTEEEYRKNVTHAHRPITT